MNNRLQSWKEDITETYLLVKACLTSFWFWLPTLYASYLFIQIWLMIAIHPLTILIVPGILAIYAITQEEKHMKAQYGIGKEKTKLVMQPYSLMPEKGEGFKWDVEKSLEEYKEMTEKNEEK